MKNQEIAARLGERAAGAVRQRIRVVGELHAVRRALLAGEVGAGGPGDQVNALLGRGRSAGSRGQRNWRRRRPARRAPGCRSTRAPMPPPTSGLFWSSACSSSIGRSSTEPPKSAIAISIATRLPGPPTSRYGPLMSLSRPMRTDFELLCARTSAGLASAAAESPASSVRRAIVGNSLRFPIARPGRGHTQSAGNRAPPGEAADRRIQSIRGVYQIAHPIRGRRVPGVGGRRRLVT